MIVASGVGRDCLNSVMNLTRLDNLLGYAESHRATVCVIAGAMIAVKIPPNTPPRATMK